MPDAVFDFFSAAYLRSWWGSHLITNFTLIILTTDQQPAQAPKVTNVLRASASRHSTEEDCLLQV